MAAAAAVISERGFEASTMVEIAARADARIGSLYRFFPTKELLAEVLMQRYVSLIEAEYDAVDARAKALTPDQLADAFIDFMLKSYAETTALVALMDSRIEWSGMRLIVRNVVLQRIARTLLLRAPNLGQEVAEDVAVVLLNNMKLMVAMTVDKSVATSPGAANELRLMNRLYLASKLAASASRPRPAAPASESEEPVLA